MSLSPSKEMGDSTGQRKKSPTSVGFGPTTTGFDRSLLSYELQGQTEASSG